MKQTYCQSMIYVPEYMDVKFVIPAGTTLRPGNIIKAEKIEGTLVGEGNIQTYLAEEPASGDDFAIVTNGGFYTTPDGNRPNGYPDYTQFEFIGGDGEVYSAMRMQPYVHFEITQDCVDLNSVTPAVGQFLIPNGYSLQLTATEPESGKYFEIKAIRGFQAGGLFGGQRTGGIIPSFVCMVKDAGKTA